ncbi:Bax inhibitor-1/YccA family protein [Candidatus Ruminimicrobiellum ovillum]|uniref:Bax inhibitor-1/YccA family protein n=1 Tax=Candidatus Ruminimicrobiellum ovillum TaxID=1947927 RepID=UPI003559B678
MNPVLNKKTFQTVSYGDDVMTINGVINKSFILWLFLAAGAYFGWTNAASIMNIYFWLITAGALALCVIISFNVRTAPYFSPIYAFGEGLVLGAITLFAEKDYPGIAVNAIFLTICDLFLMLAAFKSGKIRATKKFVKIVALSTAAICLVYFLDIILLVCHTPGIAFIHSSGALGILVSVFVVIIASLNLVVDFEFIQNGVEGHAPKYMEWYGAFALMVTIVWLYLEILRLLSKVRD